MTRRAVVVGGGIAGIVSAHFLSDHYDEIHLVETGSQLGGLFRSTISPGGVSFDLDSHIPRETGREVIDEFLFGGLDSERWHSTNTFPKGNYFCGSLNSKNQYPDMRLLPSEWYARAVTEVLSSVSEGSVTTTARENLLQRFGPTITNDVLEPAARKFMGTTLDHLAPGVNDFFLGKVTLLTPEATRQLKHIDAYDKKIGSHFYQEELTDIRYIYPRHGGVQDWIAHLHGRLSPNVIVHLQTAVDQLIVSDGAVIDVRFSTQEQISCTDVVWTASPIIALRSAGIHVDAPRPRFVPTTLFHLTFDRPFLSELFTVLCFDINLIAHRVTLYPNIRGAPGTAPFNVTVSVLHPSNGADGITVEQICFELQQMQLVSTKAQLLESHVTPLLDGFPLPTVDVVHAAASARELAKRAFTNMKFVGRESGDAFLIDEVIADCYTKLAMG